MKVLTFILISVMC